MSSDANSAQKPPPSDGAGSKAGWFLLGGAALLAAGSIGYNVYDGDPQPPLAAAPAPDAPPSIEDLRAAAQAADDDANAWARLAFAHYEREEFADAVAAYERVVAIDDGAAEMWSALGEARVMAVDAADADADPLPASAIEAFEKALERDPGDPRARYFMAVKRDLAGDHAGAISDWLALLADTPPGAPWERDVVRTIRQVGAIQDIAVDDRIAAVLDDRAPAPFFAAGQGAPEPSVRGPSAQQIAEAQQMSSSDRDAMVAGMVSSLEARLQDEPQNLDGWVMLIRSRATLGETGKAREALANAIAANPGEADELRRQAAMLGIE
ncbi:MAG: cytochrome C biogenesis protein CycH [Erythrobacter sp.]|nr:cytochrome C biogenesis protein CycH [Erythrobacter sp.]